MTYGTPWDIQWQTNIRILEVENRSYIISNPKLWFSTNPPTNKIFAFTPPTNLLQIFTLQIGKVNPFFVDNNRGDIWIATTDGSSGNEVIYRMPVSGGKVLGWRLNRTVTNFNSIRTEYLVNPGGVAALLTSPDLFLQPSLANPNLQF